MSQSRLETIPEEMLLEITLYLNINQLPQLLFISKFFIIFCERNLRNILSNGIKASRLDLKLFEIKDLFYLYQVMKTQYKLNMNFFITDAGQVYAWGNNSQGQLGLGNRLYNRNQPELIRFFDKMEVVQIFARPSCSLFLTKTGQVYACGWNAQGQLGIGGFQNKHFPTLITDLTKIEISRLSVEGGYGGQSLFLTTTGQVYACGDNHCGQLGLGDHKDRDRPELITALLHLEIIQVTPGTGYSLFLTNSGQVYICGCGYHQGKRLFGSDQIPSQIVLIAGLDDVKMIQISAGLYHNLFLTDSGQVYAYGLNDAGQLGLGNQVNRHDPVLVTTFIDTIIIRVSAGYRHSLFLTYTGQVYACGDNDHGQLGLGDQRKRTEPVLITALADLKIVKICALSYFSLFLDSKGQVRACGYNGYGQLCLGEFENPYLPELVIALNNL